MVKIPLILVGGGGHCKSVIDVAESAGYTILGILDKPEEVGKQVLDYKVIGTDDDIPQYVDKAEFLITVGQIKSAAIRKKVAERIRNAGGRLATIIAPDAYISKYASVGEGSIIMHRAFLNAEAVVGCNTIINTLTNLGHEVKVGDFCHLSTGVMVCGNVTIGDEVFIGSQSVVNQGVQVSSEVVIGSMTCVNKSITESGTYAGVPAEKIKNVKQYADNKPVKTVMGGGKIILPIYAACNRVAA